MTEKKTQSISINDTEYNIEDLTEQQVAIVNHLADLERKIKSAMFNVEQLNVGKEAFIKMFEESQSE